MEMLISFSFTLHLSTMSKLLVTDLMTMVLLAWPELHRLPIEFRLGQLSRGGWETPDPKIQRSQATWASITPQECHRLTASMQKENKYTFLNVNISVLISFFALVIFMNCEKKFQIKKKKLHKIVQSFSFWLKNKEKMFSSQGSVNNMETTCILW